MELTDCSKDLSGAFVRPVLGFLFHLSHLVQDLFPARNGVVDVLVDLLDDLVLHETEVKPGFAAGEVFASPVAFLPGLGGFVKHIKMTSEAEFVFATDGFCEGKIHCFVID